MPVRKKPGKETTAHQPSLFEKISEQAVHISHEIAAGTGHLLEVAADKFSAVKEKIINKIGTQTPSTTDEPGVKKKSAKKKAVVKVKKVAVVRKKAVAVKAKQPLKKTTKKKVAPKKATKKIARRK